MLLLKRLVGSILIVFGVLVAVMGLLALAPPPDAEVNLGIPLALVIAGVGVAIGLFGERGVGAPENGRTTTPASISTLSLGRRALMPAEVGRSTEASGPGRGRCSAARGSLGSWW